MSYWNSTHKRNRGGGMDTATRGASSSSEGHNKTSPPRAGFTRYQIFVVAILAFLQFTIILDFMIVSPWARS